jgi:hypothetical protein
MKGYVMVTTTRDASKAIKQALEQHYGKGNVLIRNIRGSGCYLLFDIIIRAPGNDEETVERLIKEVAPRATLRMLQFCNTDKDFA